MKYFLLISFIAGWPLVTRADEIAELLEEYNKLEEADRRDTEEILGTMNQRLEFNHSILNPIVFSKPFSEACKGKQTKVTIEPKALNDDGSKNTVFWGAGESGAPATVRYKRRDGTIEEITNPVVPTFCHLDKALISEVVKFACSMDAVKISIHSAFRPIPKNAAVGGVGKSQHLKCKAIDFSLFKKQSNSQEIKIPHNEVQQKSRSNPKFTGLGLGVSFTHLDNREKPLHPPRDVWTYSKKPR